MKRTKIDETTTRFKVLKFALELDVQKTSKQAIEDLRTDFDRSEMLWNEWVSISNQYASKLEVARREVHAGYALVGEQLDKLMKPNPDFPGMSIAEVRKNRSELWKAQKVNRKEADQFIDMKKWGLERRRALQQVAWIVNCKIRSTTPRLQLSRFEVAYSKALKDGASLRYHRIDGSGIIALVMRELGANQDGISIEELMGNEKRRLPLKFHRADWQSLIGDPNQKITNREKRALYSRVTIKFRVDQEANFILHQHRKIKAGTIIKGFQVTSVRQGDEFKHFLCLTVMETVTPNPIPKAGRGMIGVVLGWKIREFPPVTILETDDGKQNPYVDVSPEILLRWRGLYLLQSKVQLMVNDFLPILREFSAEFEAECDDEASALGRFFQYLLSKMNGKTMPIGAMLRLVELADKGELSAELKDSVLTWWRVDRMIDHHNERREACYRRLGNTRRHLIEARNDMYRVIANNLVTGESDVAVCAGAFAEGDFKDMDAKTIFAVSTLQEFIKQKCAGRGVDFYKISPPQAEKGEVFTAFDVYNIGIAKRNQEVA